jgi:hypothetical protein
VVTVLLIVVVAGFGGRLERWLLALHGVH